MKMLTDTGGEHAIIRSGRVPVMTRADEQYRISGNAVPRATVARIARYLLPHAELQALSEIGETRYHLPHRLAPAHEDFIVDVSDHRGELCVDIQHHKLSDWDEVPEELIG